MRRTISVLTAILILTACATGGDLEALRAREWTLVSVEGIATLPVGASATPTMQFARDGRLGANTGCNSAGASYTTEGDRITFGPILSTKRACADPRGNELETAVVRALEATRVYRVEGDTLTLLAEDGRTLATLR